LIENCLAYNFFIPVEEVNQNREIVSFTIQEDSKLLGAIFVKNVLDWFIVHSEHFRLLVVNIFNGEIGVWFYVNKRRRVERDV